MADAARRPLSETLEEGRALFNEGRFFEAHERWEEAWLVETGPSKLLLQGLIQIAAGFLKARQGRSAGAVRLLESGARKVAEAGASPELAGFLADVRQRTGDVREILDGASTWPLLPPLGSVK
jgi:predicted metal-dependent hydrolase